jgi:hypothetical protein
MASFLLSLRSKCSVARLLVERARVGPAKVEEMY